MMSTFSGKRPVAIDVFEVNFFSLHSQEKGRNRWGKLDFFHFLFSHSFIDVYCAKTIMEICYALGAMEEIFIAVFFYSPGYVQSDNNEIYCLLKWGDEKEEKVFFFPFDGRVLKGLELIKIVIYSECCGLRI